MADGALFLSQLEALMQSAASYETTGEVPDRAARRADALVRWCSINAASGQLLALGGDRSQVLDRRAGRAGGGSGSQGGADLR